MDASGFEFSAMSSVCEVRLEGVDEPALAVAAQAAIDEVRRIEAKYSRYRDDSIVSRLNAAAGTGVFTPVDAETASLLRFAAQLHALSDGLFDITSGVLRRAWDFSAGRVPDAAELAQLLPLIGAAKIEWRGERVHLPLAGMQLDFGGFGKEYAADRAASVLEARGQRHGFVNLGGDIRVVGPRHGGRPWRFGIQHPRRTEATIASIDMAQGALASSGDYERYFEQGGKRFCHILDPRSGWPVSAWASVSVTAPACVAAGALSTIAMLKGDGAIRFLRDQRVGFLAVDTALQPIQSSPSAEGSFVLGVS
jgi:FAD:protein FMN transferase